MPGPAAGETRWERAIGEARRLFTASSGAEMALATTADGLVEGPTTDLALIESALERSRPGGGDATAWPRLAGATAVHFITDGATARPLDSDVFVHSVFEPAANVGITALEVRPSLSPGNAGDAYLEIGNFAPSAQKVRVRITAGQTRGAEPRARCRGVGTAAPGAADPPRRRPVADGRSRGVGERAARWTTRRSPGWRTRGRWR